MGKIDELANTDGVSTPRIQVTGVPTAWIQQALDAGKKEGVIAGGFKWRIADEKTVDANKQLWKNKASHSSRVR